MEPKNPIVIDGVDVSGCEFYCDKYCSLSNDRNEQLPFVTSCSEYSNCMFKQLARKERECQRTEQKLTLIRDFITDTHNHYYMLLCNDRRDFTIVTLDVANEEKRAAAAFTVVDECLVNRGKIKAIDLTEHKDAIEIWLNIDDEEFCYYFFPYDNAVIEI